MSMFDKKQHMMGVSVLILGLCTILLTSYAQADSAGAAPTKKFEKFVVYKDKPSPGHFVPSGFMPDGNCVAINDAWVDNCQPGARSCIQNKFDRDCTATSTGWAGIFWLAPANNWGDIKGGYNLTGATKLVFWAKGEKGGETVTFKMGGVGMGHPFPDSDGASSEPIVLTKDWKEYSIDLTGKDLSYIGGGFAWVGTAKENQNNITFYVGDIYYI